VVIAQALNQELHELGCFAGLGSAWATPLDHELTQLALLGKNLLAWWVQ
jgi:hypothetical protein